MTYSATGIVLRRTDVREWDRLYTVLTREHGKLLLVGKGTRRPKAKLAAHCEPLAEVDFEIARGRQLDRIIFARTLRTNEVFAISHTQFALASFCCECVDALTKDAHPDLDLYDLLRDVLAVIARSASARDEAISPFILRLAAVLGYAPILDRCVECRRDVPEGRPALGVPWRGGVVCVKCSTPSQRGSGTVSPPPAGLGSESLWLERRGRSRGGGTPQQDNQHQLSVLEDAGAILLTPTDRALLSACVSSFAPQPITQPAAAFADQLLAAHLPHPLRTPQFILSPFDSRGFDGLADSTSSHPPHPSKRQAVVVSRGLGCSG